jgi:Dockerin type I domain
VNLPAVQSAEKSPFAQSVTSASVTAGILVGDTNGDGTVNSADISQTKSRSGQAVDGSDYRSDLTADGSINSADISLVKSKSGTALPASPSQTQGNSKKLQ